MKVIRDCIGGVLSFDEGFLLIKKFAAKIGFTKLIKNKFKTNDKSVRFYKEKDNLKQMVYWIITSYFEDDCAYELTHNLAFQVIFDKGAMAS